MSKLHELLAVEGDLEGTFKKILEETTTTFTKRADHFIGSIRHLEWFESDQPDHPKDHVKMETTVNDKLSYQEGHVVKYFDALLQKEATNQEAVADLVVNGVTVAKDLPATFLLGLESRLKKVREVYASIPTLAPHIKWEKDESKGKGVWSRVHPEETMKTEKVIKAQILYPHKFPKEGEKGEPLPAQVDKISETRNVGKYVKNVWAGVLSPAEKSALLGRIDKLIQAVKKARQRANTTEVKKLTIGKELFDFIHAE